MLAPQKTPKQVPKAESKPLPKPKEVPIKDAPSVKIEQPKEEEKKVIEPTKEEKKSTYDLKNLLASVEKVRKAPTLKKIPDIPSDNTDGIQEGQEGRIDEILTISERDYLASELQKCWNVNAGVERADEIVVEVKAWVNKDGSVRDVKIINSMSVPSTFSHATVSLFIFFNS